MHTILFKRKEVIINIWANRDDSDHFLGEGMHETAVLPHSQLHAFFTPALKSIIYLLTGSFWRMFPRYWRIPLCTCSTFGSGFPWEPHVHIGILAHITALALCGCVSATESGARRDMGPSAELDNTQ
jgi:hypothetical protein